MEKNSEFRNRVYKIIKKIPRGEVMTYKQVAEKTGCPRAWRAVGNILNKNKDKNIPCHRVIKSNDKIGGYKNGERKKISLLKKEGFDIIINSARVTNFKNSKLKRQNDN